MAASLLIDCSGARRRAGCAGAGGSAQQLDTSKPIRLIVALSAGGGTDVTARLIAQQMTQNMGMTVLVENKPGGNFIPAGKEVLVRRPTATRSISSRRAR